MDVEKLIEQYMQAADKWGKRHPVTDTFDLRVQDALRDAATALSTLQAENEKLRAELEQVKAERDAEMDAIEQDFRAFTKQWWEEVNGFPCRFCKFENSGGCEQKAKHPDDEKPCAGRWFEWRGIKKEDGHGTALQNDTLCVRPGGELVPERDKAAHRR